MADEEFTSLWLRFKSFDPDASARVFDQFNPRIQRALQKFRLSDEQREDLSQQCWLKVLEAREQFRGTTEGEFVAWLLALSRHSALDSLKKKSETPDSELLENQRSTQPDQDVLDLSRWLDALESGDRKLLVDHVFFEKSFEELSDLWNEASSTLRQRYFRLRKRLAESLRKDT